MKTANAQRLPSGPNSIISQDARPAVDIRTAKRFEETKAWEKRANEIQDNLDKAYRRNAETAFFRNHPELNP